MKNSKLAITVQTSAAIGANRFVNYQNGPAALGDPILGIAAFDAEAGADLTVDVAGFFFMPAGAPIVQGALVGSDANALPITVADANLAFGRALTSAANPGDTVKILQR